MPGRWRDTWGCRLMKNRIDACFEEHRKAGKKVLITFVTAGDPDLEATRRLVLAMERSGAGIVELGVPYSDPVSEGPVIQAANARALQKGVRLDHVFGLVRSLREQTQIPLVFLLYANTILHRGVERFFREAAECGLDGVIVPDLPFEESGQIHPYSSAAGLRLIRLVAPNSGERIRMIAERAEGFLYCVSSLGVTGMRERFGTDFKDFLGRVDEFKAAPSAVGFGISGPSQAAELARYADGVIVGSAIVKTIAETQELSEAVKKVQGLTAGLYRAINGAGGQSGQAVP